MASIAETARIPASSLPDAGGHFGQFGGKYVPETLMGALTRLEREYHRVKNDPDFTADADPSIDRTNLSDIVRYAYILQKLGKNQRAAFLLAAALPVARGLPRMGLAGHGIRDVQILALQGKSFEALTALRESIDEGFRGTVPSNGWPMSLDPYLESIRGKRD